VRGKYVADGVFDPNVVDKQLGCAGLIMAMRALDASIFPVSPVKPVVKVTAPATAGGAAAVAAAQSGLSWPAIAAIGIAIAVMTFLVFHFNRKD
jgi:hypothetical protein